MKTKLTMPILASIYLGFIAIGPIGLLIISPKKGMAAIALILTIIMLAHNNPKTDANLLLTPWIISWFIAMIDLDQKILNFKPIIGLTSMEMLRTITPKTKKSKTPRVGTKRNFS